MRKLRVIQPIFFSPKGTFMEAVRQGLDLVLTCVQGRGGGLMTIDLGLNLFGDRKVLLVITRF